MGCRTDDASGPNKYASFGVLRSGFRSLGKFDEQYAHVLVEHRWMFSRPGYAKKCRPALYDSRLYLKPGASDTKLAQWIKCAVRSIPVSKSNFGTYPKYFLAFSIRTRVFVR